LLQMIEEADVFQLFWSRHAMESPYVRGEYEHALSLHRPNFVRPTYWEEPLPSDPARNLPPESLLRLHFQRIGPFLLPPAAVGVGLSCRCRPLMNCPRLQAPVRFLAGRAVQLPHSRSRVEATHRRATASEGHNSRLFSTAKRFSPTRSSAALGSRIGVNGGWRQGPQGPR
jgi:hypothetical protein